MISFLLYALLAWFLYKLIFGFIIPVYRTTRKFKAQFREMRERMESQQGGHPGYSPQEPAPAQTSKAGDYIDFEEVK